MKDKAANTEYRHIIFARIVLAILITLSVTFCWLMLSPSLIPFAEKRGVVGDLVGGLSGPTIGIISAWLVYISFQAQIRANRIQIEALENEKRIREEEFKEQAERRKSEMQEALFKESVTQLLESIDRMEFCDFSEQNHLRARYRGVQAVYRFAKHFRWQKSDLAWASNEILLDQLKHWMFDLKQLTLTVDTFENVRVGYAGHIIRLYSGTVMKSLNTILERDDIPEKLSEDVSFIRSQKEQVEAWFDDITKVRESAERDTELVPLSANEK